jgi:hypothetical protein
MFLINKNAISGSNPIYPTLNEMGWNGTDNLFMKLVGKESSNEKIVTLGNDTTTNSDRFNKFILIASGSEDLSNAIVDFSETSYNYFIYSSPSASILVTSPLLEKGLLKVEGLLSNSISSFEVTGSNNTYIFK